MNLGKLAIKKTMMESKTYQYFLILDGISYGITFERFCDIGIYFKTFGSVGDDQTYHVIHINEDLRMKILSIIRDFKINSIQ